MEKGESSTSDELRPFIKRAVAKMAQSGKSKPDKEKICKILEN